MRADTDEPIDANTRDAILDAGRLSQRGHNSQHWRFSLIEDNVELSRIADPTNYGGWLAEAAVSVVLVTDPEYYYHEIDAGRAITHRQFLAWDRGIGSCICTNFDDEGLHGHLEVPGELTITALLGSGYPPFDVGDLQARKDRKPLAEVVSRGWYGPPFERNECPSQSSADAVGAPIAASSMLGG